MYGSALTTGSTVEDVKSWPERIRAVTASDVREAARTWFNKRHSVTGYLVKDPGPARRSAREHHDFTRLARTPPLLLSRCFRRGPAAPPIERVVSPGGIEAWLVRHPSVPLVAIEFTFRGGAAQDPAGRPGTAHLVAALLDEGSGDRRQPRFMRSWRRRSSSAYEASATGFAGRCAP